MRHIHIRLSDEEHAAIVKFLARQRFGDLRDVAEIRAVYSTYKQMRDHSHSEDCASLLANTETFDAYNAKCIRCGMPALRDPWLHAERYGHQPQFQRDGKVFQFDTTQGVSREVK